MLLLPSFSKIVNSLCLLVPDHVDELCLHELAVVVGDGVLEGVLVALLALALVPASLEPTPEDGDTLESKQGIEVKAEAYFTR